MTITASTPYVKYACTGTTEYIYAFKIYEDSDLIVRRITTAGVATALTLTTDYSVDDNGDGTGGTITTVSTYSDGYLEIYRELDFVQETKLNQGGPMPAERLEDSLDRNVMLMQQLKNVVENASLAIKWQGSWVTATAYEIHDTVSDSSTSNIYICVEDHTSGTFSTDLGNGKWQLFVDVSSVVTYKTAAEAAQTAAELAESNTEDLYDDVVELTATAVSAEAAARGCVTALEAFFDASGTLTLGVDHSAGDITFSPVFSYDALDTRAVVAVWDFDDDEFYVDTDLTQDITHDYPDPGTYTVSVTAYCFNGTYSTDTIEVTASAPPPLP